MCLNDAVSIKFTGFRLFGAHFQLPEGKKPGSWKQKLKITGIRRMSFISLQQSNFESKTNKTENKWHWDNLRFYIRIHEQKNAFCMVKILIYPRPSAEMQKTMIHSGNKCTCGPSTTMHFFQPDTYQNGISANLGFSNQLFQTNQRDISDNLSLHVARR